MAAHALTKRFDYVESARETWRRITGFYALRQARFTVGTPLNHRNLALSFKALLKCAGLPQAVRPAEGGPMFDALMVLIAALYSMYYTE